MILRFSSSWCCCATKYRWPKNIRHEDRVDHLRSYTLHSFRVRSYTVLKILHCVHYSNANTHLNNQLTFCEVEHDEYCVTASIELNITPLPREAAIYFLVWLTRPWLVPLDRKLQLVFQFRIRPRVIKIVSGIEDKSYTGIPDKVINTRQGCLATTYFVLVLLGSCDSKRKSSLVFISLFWFL